ncbi:helix-turn-helix transcriptional regulator [Photobacterium andalusiense]|uniref:HTH-type transcriptional regulator AppY n=1 Tax=Photobacterium andalusiense TaxID=2204296 RepID=A0A1Y6MDR8_9GAMM|nr:AraC family transcriptional regulator [Photobacterium andalusiense]SMY34705.1 HTH-type transcriptional regulator AppY [Photobacterium andalusiense]
MSSVVQCIHYSGQKSQQLRNVPFIYPSIVWVQTGVKKLQWQNDWINIDPQHWLLTTGHSQHTFINQPSQSVFSSLQLCFFIKPTTELINRSRQQARSNNIAPDYQLDHAGEYLFMNIINMPKSLPRNVQECMVNALFEYLANVGRLHQLFNSQDLSWRDKLVALFKQHPGEQHSIESACQHFGLSKSTLIRRLREESTQFREVLAELRMGYALTLLQKQHYTQLDLAQLCGYQSETRFAQRFKKQFGLSLKEYQQTILN